LSNVRRVIAKRLSESKRTVPHNYITKKIGMNHIIELRKKLKGFNFYLDEGIKLSVNDFVTKAVSLALKDVPQINSKLNKDGQRELVKNIDVCIAVATPSGLITPILKSTDTMGLQTISSTLKVHLLK
jgi:pyruvate dehydrogenase E2 component (dihydrolipoamide acetyltransferase)